MKQSDFIQGMNKALEKLNEYKGRYFTCDLVSNNCGFMAEESYKSFLLEAGISRTNTINVHLFNFGWDGLNKKQQHKTYSMRVFALAVFTAWALKTKAYREW